MDDKHFFGFVSRGFGYANTEKKVGPVSQAISRKIGTEALDTIPDGDYRDAHGARGHTSGHKYSNNKNWTRQRPNSSPPSQSVGAFPLPVQLPVPPLQLAQLAQLAQSTTLPVQPVQPQVPVHSRSVLVESPQRLQLDPSQSQSQSRWHQAPPPDRPGSSQLVQLVPLVQGWQSPTLLPPSPSLFQHQQHVNSAVSSSSSYHPHSHLPHTYFEAHSAHDHVHHHRHQHSHHHPHSHSQPQPHPHPQPHHQYPHHQADSDSPQPPQPPQPLQPPDSPPLDVCPPSLSSIPSIPLSPFDPFHTRDGDNYFLSPVISPTSAPSDALSSIPRLPVQPDDIVSPISETLSSTSIFRGLDHGDEAHAHSPVAQPFARLAPPAAFARQLTPYSSAGASLLDDKDFEHSLGTSETVGHPAISPSRSLSAAVTSAVAHDVAHLTDERSDDWFRYTARASTISKGSHPQHPGPFQTMSVTMAADGSSVPEPLQQQQQQEDYAPMASSSFTPLPPIRRTSTFDLLRQKGLVNDYSDTPPSPIEKDILPPMSFEPAVAAEPVSGGQLPAGQAASHASPHNSMQPSAQQNVNVNPNLQGQNQSHPQPQPQPQQPAMPQHPNGPVPAGPAGPVGPPGMPQQPLVQMHPHQVIMGRGGPAGQQVAPGHMMMNGQGQTIPPMPGGRRWTEQESHLAEPLNPSNRNRPQHSPQLFPYDDKETESEGPPPQQFGGAPAQPFATRPRNASNPVPPTAANRFPSLFPSPEQHAPYRHQAQVPLPQHPLQRAQNGNPRPESFDDGSLAKELGVRVEQVPVPSVASEEANQRRSTSSLFHRGHRRGSSSVTAVSQGSPDAAVKKRPFNFVKPKPNSGPGPARTSPFNESDQASLHNSGDTAPSKTRLSELRGMIKGVGNAKEGTKDDQPVKVETIYENRQSMQNPPRTLTGAPGAPAPGIQAPQQHAGPFVPPVQPKQFNPQGQPGPPGPQPAMHPHPPRVGQSTGAAPPSLIGIARASTSGPQPSQAQPAKSEESGKKSSGGGFLGGLFHKQGHKTKDVKQQAPQSTPPTGQRLAHPPAQGGNPPFRPGQIPVPGQRIGPHPMLAGQPPSQHGPPGQSPSPTSFHDATQPPPSVETARLMVIRRPSEITLSNQSNPGTPQLSGQQRPGMPSPQGSQATFKQQAVPSPLGQGQGQPRTVSAASQTFPSTSEQSPLGKPTAVHAAAMPRNSPNRKPVGSGASKANGPFMTSAVSPGMMRPDGLTESTAPRLGEQHNHGQFPQGQQNPHPRPSGGLSLSSPEPSPVPSQSNRSSSPGLPGNQFARNSPGVRESEQGLGVFPNGLGLPGGIPGGVGRPAVPPLTPGSAVVRGQPPPSSPVPSMDQSKLAKFFGAYDGGKPAAQPQANKEKSAASKFLGAFKRSSKQSEASPTQQRPQTSPQVPQDGMQPGLAAPLGAGPSPGGMPRSSGGSTRPHDAPVRSGQGRGFIPGQIPPQQMPGGRGQPGQMPPQGMSIPLQAGRGQMPPGMAMQGGRGQMPPGFAAVGPVPPQAQRPGPPSQQANEPQYDQVPIPRGYEAVHGYGGGGMLALAGRPGPPPFPYGQHPAPMQPEFPQPQPWDPRMMQSFAPGMPSGVIPGHPNAISQGVSGGVPNPGSLQPPQWQGPSHSQSPTPPNFYPVSAQNQMPPQQSPQPQIVHQPSQMSLPLQGQVPSPPVPNPQLQQRQTSEQESQRGSSPDSQTQPNVNRTGTPQQTQGQGPIQQPFIPAPPSLSSQSAPRTVSTPGNTSTGRSTPQSQSQPMASPGPPSQPVQNNPPRQSPPTQVVAPPPQIPALPSQMSQEPVRNLTQSPSFNQLRSPDAARLTSRMSISRYPRSLEPPTVSNPTDRALTVSPEPPGPHHGPVHQVSAQNLSVNVDRANSHIRHGSEDIYDATPRLGVSASPSAAPGSVQGQDVGPEAGEDAAHENTKYAGSEKGRIIMNGGVVPAVGAGAGAGAGAGIGLGLGVTSGVAVAAPSSSMADDNMSFLDGPDDDDDDSSTTVGGDEDEDEDDESDQEFRNEPMTAPTPAPVPTPAPASVPAPAASPPQETVSAPVQQQQQMEPEEKILVDQPVELAAVHDDDDGMPMMSATSYPGQEWNPYEAGEFGDWE